MNLKQMAAFRELMLTGSVSEAARNLNRTQPSVSHMIATLEDDLGMKLFVESVLNLDYTLTQQLVKNLFLSPERIRTARS